MSPEVGSTSVLVRSRAISVRSLDSSGSDSHSLRKIFGLHLDFTVSRFLRSAHFHYLCNLHCAYFARGGCPDFPCSSMTFHLFPFLTLPLSVRGLRPKARLWMGRALASVEEAKGWADYDLGDRGDPGQVPRSRLLMASLICLGFQDADFGQLLFRTCSVFFR